MDVTKVDCIYLRNSVFIHVAFLDTELMSTTKEVVLNAVYLDIDLDGYRRGP